ncbi:MAG TPA: glycine cleavage system protein GcvH [Verrucomicrobia bacterium]|nr:glycine cleavage system protein GcvH [Verrucomicrobiota bacterium]
MTPSDRRYTETHEWVKIEKGLAVVGISDHAQKALGDITFVELPDTDQTVEQDDECGVIESVKAASDIYAPIGGTIVEVNDGLDSTPEIVNEDPYGEGWIFKLANFDKDQFEDLLDAADYEAMNEEEDEE